MGCLKLTYQENENHLQVSRELESDVKNWQVWTDENSSKQLKGVRAVQNGGGSKVDISTELGLLGVASSTLDKGIWVGETSKGKWNIYSKITFGGGNQYTTNLKFFKKAGIVGLFIQVSADSYNLANDPNYQSQFLLNTGLGITSLLVPEVGIGLLVYDVGQVGAELNNAFWESKPVNDFFGDLYRDMDK